MIRAKINVTRIDKAHLYKGEKGTYLDVTFVENRDGPDQYGNDGFVAQSVSKEAREAGVKGPIIGNWRNVAAKGSKVERPKSVPTPATPDDDVPF